MRMGASDAVRQAVPLKLLVVSPKLLVVSPKLLVVFPKLLVVFPKLLVVSPKLRQAVVRSWRGFWLVSSFQP